MSPLTAVDHTNTILAEQPPPLAIVIGIASLVVLAVIALYFVRGYELLARRSLQRIYADLAIHPESMPGDVLVMYHTYHGFIAWFSQTSHCAWLSPDDARKLLRRLLCFNLTWGLATHGVCFIIPLAIFSYFAQRRSIADQIAAGNHPQLTAKSAVRGAGESAILPAAAPIRSPSTFRRIVGWIALGLCILFVINIVVFLANGHFQGAIGGALIAVLLGWVARDWLGEENSAKDLN